MKDHYDSKEEEIADMLYEQGFTDREGNPIPDPYAPVELETAPEYPEYDPNAPDDFQTGSLFVFKPAAEWIAPPEESKPASARLFGDLWLAGELCIMFADTAKGKSILATQIAESIARGVPIGPLEMTAPPQRVLYLDFELSAEQFRERYSNNGADPYQFSERVTRTEIVPTNELPDEFKDFQEFLVDSLFRAFASRQFDAVIVDNISYLTTSTHGSSAALRLMRGLKHYKQMFGLSILVLAHTPKRSIGRGLTVNDLQGSKMLANFADNIFAIGHSYRGRDIRYIKHIKPRSTALKYDASNVLVFEIEKQRRTSPHPSCTSPRVSKGVSEPKAEDRHCTGPHECRSPHDSKGVSSRCTSPRVIKDVSEPSSEDRICTSPRVSKGVSEPQAEDRHCRSPHDSKGVRCNCHNSNAVGEPQSSTTSDPLTTHHSPLTTDPPNFLCFQFVGYSTEHEHLIPAYDTVNGDRTTRIERALHLAAHGHTQREIAADLGVGIATVNRYLQDAADRSSRSRLLAETRV
jgi:hypothetical protein